MPADAGPIREADQDRVPRDEFQLRMDALNRVMDDNRWKAVLVYGDMAEHSVLAYFSNFYEGFAPASANKLKRLLGQRTVEAADLEDQPSLF